VEVIPAIDLRGGRCVRLHQGDFAQETIFSDDPVAMARQWQEQGGPRLHLVDLDGAATGEPAHLEIISAIVAALDTPVQVGGGIRTADTARAWLEAGVDRVVIGTAAVRNPGMVQEVCSSHGSGRVVVAVDAREGMVAVQGWQEASEVSALELAHNMAALGVVRLLYTDISRDGTLSGPDLDTNTQLVRETGMAVLASGGVSSVEDIRQLVPTRVEGVIVGRALYTGAVALPEAIEAATEREEGSDWWGDGG
ncbi:1-(5-phosphoribosyl)-5-[(5-phosphoribosylamino)methylideneamino] imidazole-4-carboxamide isomerase, partial [Geodia barretti]